MAKKKGTHLIKKGDKIVVAPPVEKVIEGTLCSKCGCKPHPLRRITMGAGVVLCPKCYKDK